MSDRQQEQAKQTSISSSQKQDWRTNSASLPSPISAEVKFKQEASEVDAQAQIGRLSPAALAYLGDAVYELYIRTRYLLPPRRISDYHSQVVSEVRAETQAAYLEVLEIHLTDSEREITRRGRNIATRCPKRLSPKLYRQATSLETLFGYLYLQNPLRLNQLLEILEINPHPK